MAVGWTIAGLLALAVDENVDSAEDGEIFLIINVLSQKNDDLAHCLIFDCICVQFRMRRSRLRVKLCTIVLKK